MAEPQLTRERAARFVTQPNEFEISTGDDAGFEPLEKFDPNQPRDKDGKWTDTGGGVVRDNFKDLPPEEWTKIERTVDWLERNNVQMEGDRYVFYHGTPKSNELTFLRAGSHLIQDPEDGAFFAARDRNLKPDEVVVHRVLVTPDQIDGSVWATLRVDYDLALGKAFDPNQPRDKDGKWTDAARFAGPMSEQSAVGGESSITPATKDKSHEGEGWSVSDETRAAYEQTENTALVLGQDFSGWEQTADRAGMGVDEYKEAVTAELERLNGKADVYVRTNGGVLREILNDGRILNQHESGTSQGFFQPDIRAGFEENFFGKSQPIYGYLSDSPVSQRVGNLQSEGLDLGEDDLDQVATYGRTAIKLKSDVKERTSFTVGDSWDINKFTQLGAAPRVIPSAVTSPSYRSITARNTLRHFDSHSELLPREGLKPEFRSKFRLPDVESIQHIGKPYVEAQIHGPVTVKNIDKVIFSNGRTQKLLSAKLDAAGIPHEVDLDLQF